MYSSTFRVLLLYFRVESVLGELVYGGLGHEVLLSLSGVSVFFISPMMFR